MGWFETLSSLLMIGGALCFILALSVSIMSPDGSNKSKNVHPGKLVVDEIYEKNEDEEEETEEEPEEETEEKSEENKKDDHRGSNPMGDLGDWKIK